MCKYNLYERLKNIHRDFSQSPKEHSFDILFLEAYIIQGNDRPHTVEDHQSHAQQ